ncbi:hypothetical protein TNCV_3005821 [Trichonephila clavipes]|nr:hypothetical protein TNCV_3005821 [Trichonephila clavipes]
MDSPIPRHLPGHISEANFKNIIGYDYLMKYLYRFGLADSPACPLYNDTDNCGGQSLAPNAATWRLHNIGKLSCDDNPKQFCFLNLHHVSELQRTKKVFHRFSLENIAHMGYLLARP